MIGFTTVSHRTVFVVLTYGKLLVEKANFFTVPLHLTSLIGQTALEFLDKLYRF